MVFVCVLLYTRLWTIALSVALAALILATCKDNLLRDTLIPGIRDIIGTCTSSKDLRIGCQNDVACNQANRPKIVNARSITAGSGGQGGTGVGHGHGLASSGSGTGGPGAIGGSINIY
ncbi:hypothetical protein PNOK_0970000 [Pyrrhoderma noxium]|uniref:Uncharacterized protein n=1 Tax=Pyrrhoderma noxium TaxID=2282107 RepID=A0A286U503_9AGAM|nr:hypothetical protein PNOK_0970000 [Pyrrhoderma noxium]